MNTSKLTLVLALLAAAAPMGCQRVLDFVKGLAGGAAPTAPTGTETPTPPPTTAAPGSGPSSVRTTAPSRAQGCPATTANDALLPGTVHNGAVERDETWSLEDSPHRLPDGLEINNGVTLTLAPCAVVLVGPRAAIRVKEGGGLVAVGDAEHPIRVGSDNPQPQAGDWAHVNFEHNARRTSRLSHVVLEHGGADEVHGARACLSVWAEGLRADHVTARQCKGYGVTLQEGGTFADDARDLTVSGSVAGDAPHTGAVFVRRAPSVASVPPGTYTGNALDEVYIAEAANDDGREIRQSQVWRNVGVPYHIADDAELRVEGPAGPVLTIAPGVTLRMGRNARFFVGMEAEGALVMDGNAEETRIVLRPAGTDESPGQWSGIHFGERFNRTATRLRYVTLRNAGGEGPGYLCDWVGESTDRAFLIFDAEPQAAGFEHITFAGGGPTVAAVGRNWRNANAVDFTAASTGNDFSQWGTGCKQSPLHEANGDCPATPQPCQ